MKLDPRIIEGKKPFDCVDAESETVKSFIGKKGYFANHISEFIGTVKKQSLTFGTEESLTFSFLGI